MRRHAAFVGSIAIHAGVGLALIAVRAHEPERSTERATIELVDVDPASLVELVDVSSLSSGGNQSSGNDGARNATNGTLADSPDGARESTPLIARVDPRRTRRQDIVRPAPTDRSMSDSLAEIATASADREFLDGERGGDGGGRGGGHGNGIGRGVGSGLGDLATAGERLPTPPAAPKASKARPAKLIYPSRNRDVDDDSELFLARVTIDNEGYVVGARLVRGFGGRKDDEAAGLIFRFRYAPALDDNGRAIKSQVEQEFLVGP